MLMLEILQAQCANKKKDEKDAKYVCHVTIINEKVEKLSMVDMVFLL